MVAWVAVLVGGALGAAELSVAVAPGTPCVQRPSLVKALGAAGLQVVDLTEAGLVVSLAGDGARLRVTAAQRDHRLERVVPTSECGAVERVVVALIASWAREPLRGAKPQLARDGSDAGVRGAEAPTGAQRGPSAPLLPPSDAGAWAAQRPRPTEPGAADAEPPPPTRSGATQADERGAAARPSRARAEETARAQTVARDESSGPDAPATSVRAPTTSSAARAATNDAAARPALETANAAVSAPAPRAAANDTTARPSSESVSAPATPTDARGETSHAAGWPSSAGGRAPPPLGPLRDEPALELALLGGVGLGPTSAAAPLGGLHAGLWLGRWGLLLEGGLEGAREATQAPARVWAARQWLSLSARVAFRPLDAVTLDLAAGARGWRIAAGSSGVDGARETALFTAGGVVSAGASWRLAGPIALHARLFGALRGQAETFVIDDLGPVLTLQPFEAGLTLGLVARFGG